MKYFLVLLMFTHAILAEDLIIEENEANTDVDSAGFMMMPMGGCGNTCMCRQRCTMIWWMPCNCGPCNGCGCCDDGDKNTPPTQTEPTQTEPTTTEATTTTQTTTMTEVTTTTRNCDRNCCSGCSCGRPCTIWWMCPRPCAPSCCNGGCCNSNPTPPPPPTECCSCPTCVPWTPCQPCRCMNNCCPGSNCCSGSGCSTTTTVAPLLINDINLGDRWHDKLDNGVPEWDIRIPDRKDPWDDYPPRFPRDPISNTDRFRDRRDPVYVPPTSDMIKLEEWEIRDILERRDRRDQRY